MDVSDGTRSRKWVFTLNNYTDEDIKYFSESDLKTPLYCIIGKEVAPSTGTPHLQGFLEYKNKVSFKELRLNILRPRCRIEMANGTAQHNKAYCGKDGDIVREIGVPPRGQGKRTDLDNIKEKIKAGENKISVLIEDATSFQSVRFAECYLKYKEQKRNWLPDVKWYWGEPRSGKTRLAHEVLHDPYVSINGKWFEGYDAHENVIIDDLRREYVISCGGFGAFMNRLDRYAHQVECKGSTRQFLAKNIIITTIYEPRAFMELFFPNEPHEQLLGRLSEIKEFQIIKEKDLKNNLII